VRRQTSLLEIKRGEVRIAGEKSIQAPNETGQEAWPPAHRVGAVFYPDFSALKRYLARIQRLTQR